MPAAFILARRMPNLCENDLRILPVVRWELNAPIGLSLSPDALRDSCPARHGGLSPSPGLRPLCLRVHPSPTDSAAPSGMGRSGTGSRSDRMLTHLRVGTARRRR